MAMSWVAARKEPMKKSIAMTRNPPGRGERKATMTTIITSKNCIVSIHRRLVPYSSICGPHKNFNTHGRPKREVRPMASRLTRMSRKKTEDMVRMMV